MATRAIITACILVLCIGTATAQCDLTAGFSNSITIVDGSYEITLATDKSSYGLGETVQFETIVKNISIETTTLIWPVEYPDAIFVTTPDSADPADYDTQSVYSHPDFFMYVPGEMTLAPNACRKWTATWDLATEPADLGPYKVWGGLMAWPYDFIQEFVWLVPASGPATLSIELQEAVATTAESFGHLKATYR
ncbi:MAG: hypothetical protein QNL91_17165 [Candidatus Krumholzibacteria bacterium]|nr:hypothetical protein [Candidatus Krumholzibacteria bacterium]